MLVAAVNRAAFRVEPPAPQSHVDQGHSDILRDENTYKKVNLSHKLESTWRARAVVIEACASQDKQPDRWWLVWWTREARPVLDLSPRLRVPHR